MPVLHDVTYRRRLVFLLLVNSRHGFYSVPLFTVNLQSTLRTSALVCLWSVGLGLSGVLFYNLYKRYCIDDTAARGDTLLADEVIDRDLVERDAARQLMGNIQSISDTGSSAGYHENGKFVRGFELHETVRSLDRDKEASFHHSTVQHATKAKPALLLTNVESPPDATSPPRVLKNGVSSDMVPVVKPFYLNGAQQDDADSGWEAGTGTEDSLSSPDEIRLPQAESAADTSTVWLHDGAKEKDGQIVFFQCASTPVASTSPLENASFTPSASSAARLAALELRFQLRWNKSHGHLSRATSVEPGQIRRTGSSPPDSTCHFSSSNQECCIDVRQLQCSSLDNSPLAARFKRQNVLENSRLHVSNDWMFNSVDSLDDVAIESDLCLKDLEGDSKLCCLLDEFEKVQLEVDSLKMLVCRVDAHSASQILTVDSVHLQLQNCARLLAELSNQVQSSVEQAVEPIHDIEQDIEKLLRESGYDHLLSSEEETEDSTTAIRWSVGPLTKLDEYAAREWRGNTMMAQRISLAYKSIPPEKGVFLRQIRGDNYCALRATLFQLLLRGLEPSSCAETACARLSLASKRHAWLRDGQWICPRWRDIHRGMSNKNNIDLAACLRQLYTQCSTLSRVQCDRMREWLLLELFNSQPRVELALLEAVKVLMALRAVDLHASLQAAEQANSNVVPFYAWLLFARDTSADPATFYQQHLSRVGDSGGLEQVEMILLADVLGVRLRVLRLSAASPHADDAEALFCAEEETSLSEALPLLTLLAEDDRHYNILVS